MRREGAISDLTYSAAKAFAFKGTLLSYQALQELAESKDLDDLVTKLRGTVYAPFVTKVQRPYSAGLLELSLREHLASAHHLLIQVSPDTEVLVAYYLKYVARNLKTVLKGKASERPFEELSRGVDLYAEELIGRRDIVVKALSAESLEEAVNQLKGSEFGEEVEGAFHAFREAGKPEVMDIYLDRTFYRNLSEMYGTIGRRQRRRGGYEHQRLRPIIAVDIDSYNTLAVLRGKLWDLPRPEVRGLVIEPGMEVPSKKLDGMIAAESVAEALRAVEGTVYRGLVPKGKTEEEGVRGLEDAFEALGYDRARRTFLWDDFGISLAVGLVKMKELEAKNIAAIAYGVEQRVGAKRILEKLLFFREKPA